MTWSDSKIGKKMRTLAGATSVQKI